MKLHQPKDELILPELRLRPTGFMRGLIEEGWTEEVDGILVPSLPPMAGAGGKSDYLENKLLDHNFNDGTFAAPTPYLALTTVVPTDASTGASITEAGYTGYARLAIAAADMSAAASGSKTNSSALTFAVCTASSSTVIGVAICDASGTGAGNILYWGTCTSVVISTTQTPATVAVGALVVTED